MISCAPQHLPKIRRWLITCITLVVCMVFVGGVTRLTESGLSIVEWKLFSGVFPPLNEAAWKDAFEEYQTSPEYLKKNTHFSLSEFKGIYWLEYIHRLLGRITGMAFMIPLIIFTALRMLPRPLFWRMLGISALVGAQGTVGWVMVASGLVDDPRVNPAKLALHLSLALTVFSLLLWTWWQLQPHSTHTTSRVTYHASRFLLVLTAIQIILGALVAGNDAGMVYNTYPLMDGAWVPSGLMLREPWWSNFLYHIPMVQWQHRMGALILVMSSLAFIAYGWRQSEGAIRQCIKLFAVILCIQFGLGVATLLSVVAIAPASLHQMAAMALLAVLLRLTFLTRAYV